MKKIYTFLLLLMMAASAFSQMGQAHFEGTLPTFDSVGKGLDFRSGMFKFYGDTTPWGTWTGWAASSVSDSVTGDFSNDFAAIAGQGANHSRTYAVAYDRPSISFGESLVLTGTFITNSTYAYRVMENGNGFSKKFGGLDGNDADSFVVRAYGYLDNNLIDSSDFYLADFTYSNNKQDYIVKDYQWWDLSTLGKIDSMSFRFFSSDNGQWGINTPTYFCMDNFNGIPPSTVPGLSEFENFHPGVSGYLNGADGMGGFYSNGAFFYNSYNFEWSGWSGFSVSNQNDTVSEGFENQYSAFAGGGQGGSENFMVANTYGDATVDLPFSMSGSRLNGIYITNATYAALSMKNGDGFAKKFGGTSGDDPDWFKLEVIGYDYEGNITDTVHFYLADYRFSNNKQDYIVKDWTWVDLSSLGAVTRISFNLSSSDTGQFGMNTPAYFCLDGFNSKNTVEVQHTLGGDYTIYPNPALNSIKISFDGQTANLKAVIYDLQGRAVSEVNGSTELNIENLDPGKYIMKLWNNNDLGYASFIKL